MSSGAVSKFNAESSCVVTQLCCMLGLYYLLRTVLYILMT